MLKRFLESKKAYYLLLGLNALSLLAIFYISSKIEFPDANSYWHLAKGLKQGTFTSWYFLPVHSPDTLRTWGYPFFVLLCQFIYDAPVTVKIVQLIMHVGTILMVIRLIRHFTDKQIAINIFLLLLAINVQVGYYTAQVASECVNIFFIVLFLNVWYRYTESWKKYLILALLAFIIYQLRPVFMLVPFMIVAYKLLFNRKSIAYNLLFLFVFMCSLIPFGLWNKKEHGIFKVTPLEGGAGAANLGYWSFCLPEGYHPQFYWDPIFSQDLTQPSFVKDEEKIKYKAEYEKEWNKILSDLSTYITADDSIRMAYYAKKEIRLWEVMNGNYTYQRERLLTKHLISDIKKNPGYYIITRFYTLARLWFTGINRREYNKSSVVGKIKLIIPFAITFVFIFCGLLFIILSMLRGWLSWEKYWLLFLLIAYFGIIHLPFGVQARYTIPVHIFILMLSAISLSNIINREKRLA